MDNGGRDVIDQLMPSTAAPHSSRSAGATLAAVLCFAGAAWTVARDGLDLRPTGSLAPALDVPGFVLGLVFAAALWMAAGMGYKAWAHFVAALVFAMPRIYALPTDLFGAAPAVLLSIAAGVYLFIAMWRDRAVLRVDTRVLRMWITISLGCLALHMGVAHLFASLKAGFQLLGS
jgi:hypothetical protein